MTSYVQVISCYDPRLIIDCLLCVDKKTWKMWSLLFLLTPVGIACGRFSCIGVFNMPKRCWRQCMHFGTNTVKTVRDLIQWCDESSSMPNQPHSPQNLDTGIPQIKLDRWNIEVTNQPGFINLLLQVYESYIQHHLDYGITLCGCNTQKNFNLVQRVHNHAARLIMGNFDYINCRGIDLFKSLNLYTIHERTDYFPTTLMFKAIHGIAPHYLPSRIDMHFDIHCYDTREAGSMDVYLPTVHRDIYRNSLYIRVVNFGIRCQIL